ncbi:hypothetical protein CAOG_010016 [Capsaspora owczarzaki ATCC 30864]|uniref:Uncharacterized protein n=1 Tax=Capsaspora owczarzaki (strain ATCC 30864) TaxID=595528 RepID=A0A0D2VXM1_CAPO3|nr:hypothetical protein CAOG_010016 [Capsaspora owczarzaki ATCC 30864]
MIIMLLSALSLWSFGRCGCGGFAWFADCFFSLFLDFLLFHSLAVSPPVAASLSLCLSLSLPRTCTHTLVPSFLMIVTHKGGGNWRAGLLPGAVVVVVVGESAIRFNTFLFFVVLSRFVLLTSIHSNLALHPPPASS